MSDLVAFLNARLGEDEKDAKDATRDLTPDWTDDYGDVKDSSGLMVVDGVDYGGPAFHYGVSDHMARWDPARVLREVEAKRRILASESSLYVPGHVPTTVTLKALAAVYSDHPDYDPDWAVTSA